MRVMLDLVLNHCSREHPWFIAAGANKTKKDATGGTALQLAKTAEMKRLLR